MQDHPALKFKYDIVQYTRGNGVEFGGGQLYPHFKAPFDGMAGLDFILSPNGESDFDALALLKDGGFLVTVANGALRIQMKTHGGYGLPEDCIYLSDCIDIRASKSVCVCRYGGFGDSIQASNILPELKRQGYHVTFMTTPRGQEILKHDPHIDSWLLQDDDQVPNQELPLYWMAIAKRFDKFINLSESVEGTLLAFPGRANHSWPDSVRRTVMGKNYLEWTAQLAELDYVSEAKFYPSEQEVVHARKYLAGFKNLLAGPLTIPQRAPDRFNIMWCLAGSSMHKFYPHQDIVIARILDELPAAVIIFNGDYPCKLLESGWEQEPRIRCESGNMGIRETLTLAQQVDCVVGPETGVLNAVAFEPMAKVIMLSHSSPENLTKHWTNTTTLTPAGTSCYPCHRLHYGKEFCHEDDVTGAAICQKDIHPDLVFAAVKRSYINWLELSGLMKAAA